MAPGQKAERPERDPDRRRVVITGIGPVTPVGTGVEAFWAGLIAGRNGVREIARFPTDDLPVKVAGDVHDFEPAKWLDPK
jgi:3-oxoacyl-[acyl-carrier-protein] synthase II